MIKAQIVAHSSCTRGHELISVLATFPRIILAEVNTHRMLSKNTSSSRAIPFFKMVESVINNPFIPIAWQTHHKGMQGSEYIPMDSIITIPNFFEGFINLLKNQAEEDNVKLSYEYYKVIQSIRDIFYSVFYNSFTEEPIIYTIKDFWLKIRDIIIFAASTMYTVGKVSKQICNRLLEPFMWTTMLITGPKEYGGWDNLFNLRCPKYIYHNDNTNKIEYFKSKKDWIYEAENNTSRIREHNRRLEEDPLLWFKLNEGAAEIHMMQLTECVWDAINESTPKQLKEGEWHIPFEETINYELFHDNIKIFTKGEIDMMKIKVSIGMAAQTSYTVIDKSKDINITSLSNLHDRLITQNPPHSSPMEHCAKCMNSNEYNENVKGIIDIDNQDNILIDMVPNKAKGWCRNFRGFIPYRHIIETNTKN